MLQNNLKNSESGTFRPQSLKEVSCNSYMGRSFTISTTSKVMWQYRIQWEAEKTSAKLIRYLGD